MMLTRKELAGFAVGLSLMLAATACGTESGTPSGVPSSQGSATVDTAERGSEVDRSDPTATATAYAAMYAAGNGPGACQIATETLREQLGAKCSGQQPWNTTAALDKNCETADGLQYFKFESPVGTLERFDGIHLWLTTEASGLWSVTKMSNYVRGETLIDPCTAPGTTTASSTR